MNILLAAVNAKYIHSNLAVYSLKASAGVYESAVEIAEYTINNQTEDIFRSIYQKKPDLLFFSCYIWNRSIILELAENIRKVLPDTILWIGGPEVSYDAETFLKENPAFKGVLCGEGEYSFPKVLEYYIEKASANEEGLFRIPGITFCQQNGTIASTGPVVMMRTLDDLPFVYQDPGKFEHKIIYYESSRGCPFSCSYCLSSIDKKVRFRSTALVKKELAFFLEQKVPQVKFVDRTFNCSHSHSMEIWEFIKEHDNGSTNFHFEIAADILTEDEITLLSEMRPGLVQLEIGVQTVNEQALDAIHRTAKFEKIAEKVNQIAKAHNVHQHLDLIAGLPYEDYESFKNSFDTVYNLRPQELQLGFLKVLRGSEMYQRAEEYGIVYRSRPPYEVLSTKWISCEELMRLKEVEEMLEVYYNSLQFRCTIKALEKQFARPFALYEALADHYKRNEIEGKSYSRMQRFEILLSFIHNKDNQICHCDADMQYFDELLTLDFYLRENAKTRPAWAEDQTAYKEEMIQFYQQPENRVRYLQGYEDMSWKQTMRMTHLEHFSFDVMGTGEPKEQWFLFDYSKRDPLTGDALTQRLEI